MISVRVHSVHPRRALLICLAASALVHAAVLVLLPGWAPDSAVPAPSGLQVVILQPTPLPNESTTPAPQSARAVTRRKTQPEHAAPQQISRPAEEVLESPAVADALEPRPAVPDRPSQAAPASAVPHAYAAAYLRNPAPGYPDAARRSGAQGTVTLRVLVARDGMASRVVVEKSSGSPHLDTAALEAVKAWRFAPARHGGIAVESWMLVPIVFRLEGTS